jgi:lantibiotic modifying enzyme
MKWVRILNGLNKEKAIEFIDSIKRTIPTKYDDKSLMYGKGGLILWLAYCNKYNDHIVGIEKGGNLFNVFLEEILDFSETDFSFGKGSLGNSWVLAHLIKNNFVSESGDIFSDVIEEFEAVGSKILEDGNYDYMLAGLGTLLFVLEANKKYSIENIYERLRKIATESSDGITWKESPIVRNLSGHGSIYNLGLAHGVPGIMSIISLLNQYSDSMQKMESRDTVLKTSNWLLSKDFGFPYSPARFPFSFGDNETPFPTSIRWCYGDLGTAYLLYLSGMNIGDKRLEHESVELATIYRFYFKSGLPLHSLWLICRCYHRQGGRQNRH